MSWIDTACNIMSNSNQKSNNSNNTNNNNNTSSNDNSGGNNGNNNKDKDIALELLTISKSNILSLASIITEITNPQLRELLSSQLTNSLNEHYKLSDIAVNKQWYNAFSSPQQQLQQGVEESKSLSQ